MKRDKFEVRKDRILAGKASEQEKIDFLFQWTKEGREAPRSILDMLAKDPCWEVRSYALDTLVLDLQYKDDASESLCWEILERDPDDAVREMAATCLGSIFFNSRRSDVARRFIRAFDEPSGDAAIQWTLYDGLRGLVGWPPVGWNVPRDEVLTRGPERSRLFEVLRELEGE